MNEKVPDYELKQKLDTVIQRTTKVATAEPIVKALAAQQLQFLVDNMDRLLTDSFFTSGFQETISLLRFLYQYPFLSAINIINLVVPGLGHLRRWSYIGPEFEQMNLDAAQIGIQIRHLFLVDDWLTLALDDKIFGMLKRLTLSGIQVKIADLSNVSQRLTSDFVLYFVGDSPACATINEERDKENEPPLVRLAMARKKMKHLKHTFESIWEGTAATPIRII